MRLQCKGNETERNCITFIIISLFNALAIIHKTSLTFTHWHCCAKNKSLLLFVFSQMRQKLTLRRGYHSLQKWLKLASPLWKNNKQRGMMPLVSCVGRKAVIKCSSPPTPFRCTSMKFTTKGPSCLFQIAMSTSIVVTNAAWLSRLWRNSSSIHSTM